ncbi:hypothetical protein EPUS_04580 [Endocarpon pusillum Z07020]|uniref:Uncharacterized protein n=1 Tax=Endocarpon pusillum (strain Z07020 / HMAS-L-300199) TaxID=1263415 RepID=U1HXP4_ENDPU|nr:uncharacterized protein EPUS_04580 [Endocarpon pusillum Z07020]ERF75600.1 hypothetical protein EPUS_04580 [Endocarpon pusillum Z07020]
MAYPREVEITSPHRTVSAVPERPFLKLLLVAQDITIDETLLVGGVNGSYNT